MDRLSVLYGFADLARSGEGTDRIGISEELYLLLPSHLFGRLNRYGILWHEAYPG